MNMVEIKSWLSLSWMKSWANGCWQRRGEAFDGNILEEDFLELTSSSSKELLSVILALTRLSVRVWCKLEKKSQARKLDWTR